MVGAEAKIMIAWKATQQVIQQEGKCIQDLWINALENKLKFINKSEEKEVIKNWLKKPTLTSFYERKNTVSHLSKKKYKHWWLKWKEWNIQNVLTAYNVIPLKFIVLLLKGNDTTLQLALWNTRITRLTSTIIFTK